MKMRDSNTIGGRISDRRLRMGMTQAELAQRVGVSRPAITSWEVGTAYPSRKHTPRLVEALGVSALFIECGDEGTSTSSIPQLERPFERAIAAIRDTRWTAQEAIALKALIDVSTAV
jgi:transcriptional regulator with XRE-family HTH domain